MVEGESADGGRTLCVEQDEEPGDAVFGLDCGVVEQALGLVPACLGVDGPGRAAPFRGREFQGGELLRPGPADEVPGLAAVGGAWAGHPALQVSLSAGREGEAAGGEP